MQLNGVGLGWRPETAWLVERRAGLGFTEVIAESLPNAALPGVLEQLVARGLPVIPHGISLGLGGADRPDPKRLERLASAATRLRAPLVSEHLAFVRGGGREIGHLMPLASTRAQLDVLVRNVSLAMEALPVPLALENVASLFTWPGAELHEADLLAELVSRTGALLLLDLSNLWANACNHGFDPNAWLDRLPLDRVAYVHVAGGEERDGLYHDTHAHPLPPGPLSLLSELVRRGVRPPVLLERDHRFPPERELRAELDLLERLLEGAPAPATPETTTRLVAASDHPLPIAETQAALAEALLTEAAPPSEFDASRVRAAATSLRLKKTRDAQRHHH